MTQPFTLFKREGKGGGAYYVRFRMPDGTRSSARSSGQTTKGAATTWAVAELKRMQAAGGIIPPTLRAWSEPFWTDKCPRCTRLAEEGRPVGDAHRNMARRNYLLYIEPDPLADMDLDKIKRKSSTAKQGGCC